MLPALFTAALLATVPAQIHWESSYPDTLARAEREGKVVFLAVNMDGERANDRLAEETYADPTLAALSASTLNLVASVSSHGDKTCKRFPGTTCDAHQDVEKAVRGNLLQADVGGYVVAPQHVFLSPQGEVLLSVPYQVSAAELEWCFVTALLEVDPDCGVKASRAARPPRRLILRGVHEPKAGADAPPLSLDAARELVGEIKKGQHRGGDFEGAIRRLMRVDEKEVVEFVEDLLEGKIGAKGAKIGSGDGAQRRRAELIHEVGVHSPRRYWEAIAGFAKSNTDVVRAETAVALEQLGAPDSLKVVKSALSKEKDPATRALWLRALASVGAEDKSARKAVFKAARKEKDARARANAVIAVGSLAPGEDRDELLTELLEGGAGPHSAAAACAMAMTRDRAWIAALEGIPEGKGESFEKAREAALRVLREGSLAPLAAPGVAADRRPHPPRADLRRTVARARRSEHGGPILVRMAAAPDDPVTPQDWSRVRALLEQALERSPDERAAFVTDACDGDAALRERVLRLLARDAEPEDALDPPDAAQLSVLTAEGARIGPYELRREIGSGGMGTVHLAVRVDGEFRRRVAIKLLRAGRETDELLERFRRERQVLANLDHPGIARLIDGGRTEQGAPYLVMEYVEGAPLDEYCEQQRLGVAERVALFRKVCDAVHSAHTGLVVHRDLKPSNVLVTPDGEPKLLDFGIAKVLDAEKRSAAPEVTRAVMPFMTPAFASPEQVRGEAVTTASDVYSLSVILYRLLSGALPHQLTTTSSPAEIERIVCDEEPPRPSRVAPPELRRELSGDLDRIVMMGLRKEPRRRYASAAALSEDLRRVLAGLPRRGAAPIRSPTAARGSSVATSSRSRSRGSHSSRWSRASRSASTRPAARTPRGRWRRRASRKRTANAGSPRSGSESCSGSPPSCARRPSSPNST